MKTTETEVLLLLTGAQLLIAADKAPGALRKRLQLRGEQLLDEADEERAREPLQDRYSFEDLSDLVLRTDGERVSYLAGDQHIGRGERPTDPPPRFETNGAEGPML